LQCEVRKVLPAIRTPRPFHLRKVKLKQNGVNPPSHAALAFLGTECEHIMVLHPYSLLGVQQCFIPFPKGVLNRPSVQMQAEKHRLSCQLAEMVTCGVYRKQQKNLPISYHWFSDRGFILH
jgi:hypothetical protein